MVGVCRNGSLIPKYVMCGKLVEGERMCGRPKLKYKDIFKVSVQDLSVSHAFWEEILKECCMGNNSALGHSIVEEGNEDQT